MNEQTKEPVMDKPVRLSASNQSGFSIIELLFAAAMIVPGISEYAVAACSIISSRACPRAPRHSAFRSAFDGVVGRWIARARCVVH